MRLKTFILGLSALGFQAHAQQPQSLTVSLVGHERREGSDVKDVKLTSLNKKLKKEGLATFDDAITLKKNDGRSYVKFLSQLEKSNKVLSREIKIIDKGYLRELPKTCYSGTPDKVLETIGGLRGSVFHPTMGIQAIRYGKAKVIFYEGQTIDDNAYVRAEQELNNPDVVAAWDGYNKKSDAVLILSDFGAAGDGTELTATLIENCD